MISIQKLNKHFASENILENASLEIFEKEKIALIGANGLGKSTLLHILLKNDLEYEGNVQFSSTLSIRTVAQEFPDRNESLLDFVLSDFPQKIQLNKIREMEHLIPLKPDDKNLLEEYSHELSIFEKNGGYQFIYEVKKVLEGLGFSESLFKRDIQSFSGGEKRRALLAQLLIEKPDILILDEPTNHLDIKNTMFLEQFLKNYPQSILFVSHDQEFINNVSTHICELENKKLIKYKGNLDSYRVQKEERKKLEEKRLSTLKDEYKKLFDFVSRFKAGTRSTQAASREKRMNEVKKEMDASKTILNNYRISFSEHESRPKAYNPPLKVKSISKSFGDKLLFKDVSFQIEQGEKVALLGINGSGKSTLLNILTGNETPNEGEVTWNKNVNLKYFTQESLDFPEKQSSLDFLQKKFGLKYTDQELKSYLGNFRLDFYTPCNSLSGGEKSKLKLLYSLLTDCNFLILDEPTNHLDIYSIEGIRKVIDDFKGSIIYVTHDRYLLKSLKNRTFLLNNNELVETPHDEWENLFKHLSDYRFEKKSKTKKSNDRRENKKEENKKRRNIERELNKIEKNIQKEEESKEKLENLRLKEEYYLDHSKSRDLQEKIDGIEEIIDKYYKNWELLQDELQNISS